jgi:hypothetical protein
MLTRYQATAVLVLDDEEASEAENSSDDPDYVNEND